MDATERAAFVTALTTAAPALVVLAVRADFYPQCIRLEQLAPLLPDHQMVLGPLRTDDLRRVVLQPASRAGLEVEGGLVGLLMADLGVHREGGYEPGSLPLLAYALRATWERRQGRTLTIDGYREAGGIANAVAERAEGIYQQLDESGQHALRATLLPAVGISDAGVVRRKARRADVDLTVLDQLIQARLVTVDEDSVEISYEALLSVWPRLTEWLAEDRQGAELHQRLTQSTREWKEAGQDENLLYREARLQAAREWASGRSDLTAAQEGFLLAGTAVAERVLLQERRRSRRLRQLLAVVVVLLLVAVAGDSGRVQVWNPPEYSGKTVVTHRETVTALAYAPDGTLASISGDGTLQIVDPDGTAREEPKISDSAANELAFSPDGMLLALAASPPLVRDLDAEHDDSSLYVWDVKSLDRLVDTKLEDLDPRGLGFTPNGEHLVLTGHRSDAINGSLEMVGSGSGAQPI